MQIYKVTDIKKMFQFLVMCLVHKVTNMVVWFQAQINGGSREDSREKLEDLEEDRVVYNRERRAG